MDDDYEVEEEEEVEEPVGCPCCSGLAGILGGLGNMTYYCCRDCGAQFHMEAANDV